MSITGNSMRGPHLLLASMSVFYPLDPHPSEFTWADVVSGLVAAGRYQGQLPKARWGEVYTVAQHAYLASLICPPHLARAVLHHDDTEALWGFGDVCGPVKRIPEVAALLKPMEARVEAVVAKRIGLPADYADWTEVKAFDMMMARWEDRDLRGLDVEGEDLPAEKLTIFSPREAYSKWLDRHVELQDAAIQRQRSEVDRLNARFASYDGGDRPPSPPASLMRELHDAEETLSLLQRP